MATTQPPVVPTPQVPPFQVVVAQTTSGEPGCLFQGLWFLFVGWWLGGLAMTLAWVLNVTILGLPLGMAILNNIPKILALQNPTKRWEAVPGGSMTVIKETNLPQMSFWLRALFFIVIGWWWSGIWMGAAYFLCMLILPMPIGLGMFRLTPMMTTLRRY